MPTSIIERVDNLSSSSSSSSSVVLSVSPSPAISSQTLCLCLLLLSGAVYWPPPAVSRVVVVCRTGAALVMADDGIALDEWIMAWLKLKASGLVPVPVVVQ